MPATITSTYRYTDGVDAGSYWNNDTNAWDNTDNTFANRSIAKNTQPETSKWLKATDNNCPATISGLISISKVEIGITGITNYNSKLYAVPTFSGSTDGSQHTLSDIGTSNTTEWVDITTDTNAPSTWTLSDVQNLDIKVYGSNSNYISSESVYIDQYYVRITYSSNIINETITEIVDFDENAYYAYNGVYYVDTSDVVIIYDTSRSLTQY